jgi:SCP-2 sterol transfer family
MTTQALVRLTPLSGADESIPQTVQKGMEKLAGLGRKAIFELRVTGSPQHPEEPEETVMTIQLTPAGANLLPQEVEKPTLSAAMTTEVFVDITRGAYSPVQAFRESKLTLRGSLDLAEAILRRLAGPAGGPAEQQCDQLEFVSYDPASGSLTLNLVNFVSGATVVLDYDWGGGTFQQVVTAVNSSGFTVIQPGIPCGPLPGDPAVGVIVTAFDEVLNLTRTQGFPTPCA